MALKRVQLVSIALAVALAGVGGISYVRPLITAFPLSHNTQCRLTVADGNLRLVWLRTLASSRWPPLTGSWHWPPDYGGLTPRRPVLLREA